MTKNFSKFECLPNELIFFLFDYLYCHEIIYAFSNLNYRFQSLLYDYSPYHFNLSHQTMKTKFALLEQFSLPIEHIQSLKLENSFYPMIDVAEFFSTYPLKIFYPTLISLTFIDDDRHRIVKLISSLPNFQRLRYFSISNQNQKFNNSSTVYQHFEIILYRITTLKSFHWNIEDSFFPSLYENSRQSSIEYFHFHSINFEQVEWLNWHTKTLRSISIKYPIFICSVHRQEQTFEQLTSLKLENINSIGQIQFVFEHLTLLFHLKELQISSHFLDEKDFLNGHQWENLIKQFIPQLKIFKFFFLLNEWFLIFKPEELIESFQTNFWFIEKQWSVRCDYQATVSQTYLYTIPCLQNQLTYSYPWEQIPPRQIDEISNIHQLNLSSKIPYDLLNQSINLLSIKHLVFGSNISSEFFSKIIEHHHQHLSIEISSRTLNRILNKNPKLINYLQHIKSLKLECHLDQMRNICFSFPNLEQLVLTGLIDSWELLHCLNQLKHLTFVMVNTCRFQFIDNFNNEKWLFSRCESHLMDRNILCEWDINTLYIFID